MKYSLSWLGQFVDVTAADTKELLHRITTSVAEIETVEHLETRAAGLRAARVVSVKPISGSPGISLCEIDDGHHTVEVVCGAPNVRPDLVSIFAPVGSRIGDRQIEALTVHGHRSEGMLCSPAEIGLSETADSICELRPGIEPGTDLAAIVSLSDDVIDIDNKTITHRPDLWGHVGMAREVAVLLGTELILPSTDVTHGSVPLPPVSIVSADACTRFTASRLSVPHIGPATLTIQTALHRVGVRSINNIVDLTNYVMYELGNPLHAYDWRQIKGGRFEVRFAESGQNVQTLDELTYTLTADDIVICDAERPISLAGIMGLANSEVTDDTQEIALEAATFPASVIRRSSARLRLRTDASVRFEKSLDPELPATAQRRFARLMQDEIPGSEILTGISEEGTRTTERPRIRIKTSYINKRLGTRLRAKRIQDILSALGFEIGEGNQAEFEVHIPSFRATGDIEIAEDLVEEIGRIHGYDNIRPARPEVVLRRGVTSDSIILHSRIQYALSLSLGFSEIQTYSFTESRFLNRIGVGNAGALGVRNPISAEASTLRLSLLPGLLNALELNRRKLSDLRFYEIGRVFRRAPSATEIPVQPFHLGLLLWQETDLEWDQAQPQAVAELKGVVENLAVRLGGQILFRGPQGESEFTHPVRSSSCQLASGANIGTVGALHPNICSRLGCGPFAAVAELDLTALLQKDFPTRHYDPLLKHPGVPVDVSIIVDESVQQAQIQDFVLGRSIPVLQKVEFVQAFRGSAIPDGQKSLTYRLHFQSPERTLVQEEVNSIVDDLIAALAEQFGAWIRT